MEPKFNYSLFGYDPAAVQHKIDLMKKEYEETMKGLSNELFLVNGEADSLKEKICGLVEEISQYENANQEIINILFTAHMQATEKVYKSSRSAEQMAIEIRETVLKQEQEYEKLKNTLKRLTVEMRSIARSYNLALEESENE